jgi:hypothetical protein
MEYFLLEHPPNRVILCNRSGCEGIADYLEINEQGCEDLVCAAHTSSERHASVLPNGIPSTEPYRSRPAAYPCSVSLPWHQSPLAAGKDKPCK